MSFPLDISAIFRAGRSLIAGAVIAKIASLLLIPVIARIYLPEDFSELALFTAILVLIGPLLTLRYSQALVVPRSDVMLANLVALCLTIGIAISLLSGFVTLLYFLLREEKGGNFAPYMPLVIVASTLPALFYEILSSLAIRDRKYTLFAQTQASQAVFGSLAKVGLGLLGATGHGLIIGHVISQFSGVRPLLRSYWHWWLARRNLVTRRNMRLAGRAFWQFPAFRLPSQLLLAFAAQSPTMFVVWRYVGNQSGQFALAMSLVTIGTNLVGASLGRAFLGEAGEIYRNERHRIARYTIKMQVVFSIIFAPFALFSYFTAESLLSFVLGPNWSLAAKIAPTLILYGIAQVCAAPVIQVLTFMNHQVAFLFINAARLVSVFILFAVTVRGNLDMIAFTELYSMVMISFYLFVAISVFALLLSKTQNLTQGRNDN